MREYILKNIKKITYILYATCYILYLSGCAGTTVIKPALPTTIKPEGVYHRVEKGETLWRISKKYSVDLDDLAKANHILDATRVEIGRMLFIPESRQPVAMKTYPGDDFIWPLEGKVISSFGQSFNNMVNKGLNIQAGGPSDVLVSRGGKVVFYSDSFLSFGRTLIVDHQDGFLTVYAGLSEVLVRIGDDVMRAVPIARVYPVSNIPSDKQYLHFEIRKGYLAQNPYFYLP